MRNDLTTEQLQQPVAVTLPLGTILRLAESDRPAAGAPAVHTSALFNPPGIGDSFEGGIYAGITLEAGLPQALILLPGDEELNWKDAIAWAEKQGGVLPSRIDQLVLLQNLKAQFQERAYWSGAQHAALSVYAWFQTFGYGSQSLSTISTTLRARSVRRKAI